MVKAVFTHAEGSIYDDNPEERYHFPRTYLGAVERAVGDWIVYYEPRRVAAGSDRAGGRQVYFAAARVTRIDRDPARPDHFYARMADYLDFTAPQPFRIGGRFLESGLRRDGGAVNKGAFGRAVRNLPDPEFEAIVAAGFAGVRDALGEGDWAAEAAEPAPGFAEPEADFERLILHRMTARAFRDAAFARRVKAAYRATCAATGLRILNGGGRPEVQAAHIRPVHQAGPDTVRNGLALCGTAHWMFDRGLISVDDDYSLLVARDRLPEPAARLLTPDRRLIVPDDPLFRPDRRHLAYHRETIFKG